MTVDSGGYLSLLAVHPALAVTSAAGTVIEADEGAYIRYSTAEEESMNEHHHPVRAGGTRLCRTRRRINRRSRPCTAAASDPDAGGGERHPVRFQQRTPGSVPGTREYKLCFPRHLDTGCLLYSMDVKPGAARWRA